MLNVLSEPLVLLILVVYAGAMVGLVASFLFFLSKTASRPVAVEKTEKTEPMHVEKPKPAKPMEKPITDKEEKEETETDRIARLLRENFGDGAEFTAEEALKKTKAERHIVYGVLLTALNEGWLKQVPGNKFKIETQVTPSPRKRLITRVGG